MVLHKLTYVVNLSMKGEGGQKSSKFCLRSLWTAPKQPIQLEKYHFTPPSPLFMYVMSSPIYYSRLTTTFINGVRMGRVRGTGFFSKATISDLKIPSEFFRYNIAYILLKEGRGREPWPCTNHVDNCGREGLLKWPQYLTPQ